MSIGVFYASTVIQKLIGRYNASNESLAQSNTYIEYTPFLHSKYKCSNTPFVHFSHHPPHQATPSPHSPKPTSPGIKSLKPERLERSSAGESTSSSHPPTTIPVVDNAAISWLRSCVAAAAPPSLPSSRRCLRSASYATAHEVR